MSIEDNLAWFKEVGERLRASGLAHKVELRFIPCDLREQDEPESHAYANVVDEFADESLDFALVDGNIRLLCMLLVVPKLKPGGLLVLDNANRYVPNRFLGGHSTVHEARSEPPTPAWGKLLKLLDYWRWIAVTDGIWDARMWVKPMYRSNNQYTYR